MRGHCRSFHADTPLTSICQLARLISFSAPSFPARRRVITRLLTTQARKSDHGDADALRAERFSFMPLISPILLPPLLMPASPLRPRRFFRWRGDIVDDERDIDVMIMLDACLFLHCHAFFRARAARCTAFTLSSLPA